MNEKTEDRRTRKTKKAICDAFAELLTEKELHRITVKEIIDKAHEILKNSEISNEMKSE